MELIGNASRYIHTHYAYATAFIVYSIQVFSSHDDKVNNDRKRKRGGRYEKTATERLSFLLSIKAYVKIQDLMLHISEFRVQISMLIKVDFHCRFNFTWFTHLYLTGFTCANKIEDNE